MTAKIKRSEQERANKLKASLPDMTNDTEAPVFPRIQLKNKHHWPAYLAMVLCFMGLVFFKSAYQFYRVDGNSMQNTLQSGELVLLHKQERVKRFSIVVLSERTKAGGPSKRIIKRVIGFPGDTVTVINGRLYINQVCYHEIYLSPANAQAFKTINWTIHVPRGRLFVLGDNRDISKDSRTVGCFKRSAVIGVKVWGGKS